MIEGDVFDFVGSSIHGKYRIDDVVGEGGFGVVYRGFHLSFELPIAVKCLKIPGHFTPDARQLFLDKFRDEGKHLASLSQHASVTRVYDFAVAKGPAMEAVPYLVLEWLEGKDLEKLIAERRKAGRPFAEREALELLRPAIDALAFAHQLGIAHRDIKPANLFLTETPRGQVIKVLDFGIAKVMQDGDVATQRATRTSSGFRAFSPGYGAPEQFNSGSFGSTGPWTDVHALGLILSEMVSGRSPLDLSNAAELFMTATGSQRPTPSTMGASVSDGFEHLCARALALMPEQRFDSADQLLEAVDELLQGQPPSAKPTSAATPVSAKPTSAATSAPATPTPAQAPLAVAPTEVPGGARYPGPPPAGPPAAGPPAAAPPPPYFPPPPLAAPPMMAAPSRRSGPSCAVLAVGAGLLALLLVGAGGALLYHGLRRFDDEISSRSEAEDETDDVPVAAGSCRAGLPEPCRRRCQQGEQSSCVELGWMHVEGNGVPKSYDEAVALFRAACDAGEALGCNNLGWLHHKGWGVVHDEGKAVVYYRKACDGRDGRGCNNLGDAYKNGVGVAEDIHEAMRIFELGCKRNNAFSCNNLGIIYDSDDRVPHDDARAAELYRKACDGGAAVACGNLGYLYDKGEGVPQNPSLAVTLYRKGCDGDSPLSCNNLGWAFERGLPPLQKNLSEAKRLYQLACSKGHQLGCRNVQRLGS